MPYSKVTYTATAGQTNYGVTFPYLVPAHVTVSVNGVLTTAFTWFNASTIALNVPSVLNDVVLIQRNSSRSLRLNDYQDGNKLTEADLDLDGNQILYIAQESFDYAESLSIRVDGLAVGGIAPLASNIAFTGSGNLSSATVQAALTELDTEKVAKAGDTMTGALVLSGNPVGVLDAAPKQYVDTAGFSGLIGISLALTAPGGWLNLQGGTLGNAASGATVRANADTSGLFTYLWTNLNNTLAPVSGGRGGSAAADFAANKTITLPDWRNRSPMGAGQATVVEAFDQAAVVVATDAITVASNDRRWTTGMVAIFNILTGSITGAGLTNGATVYVIRTGATTIKLATTLANAQNGTAIDITAVGAVSTFTLTHTFTSRTVGESGGEESHAMSSTELLSHIHGGTVLLGGGASGFTAASSTATSMGATGGNAALNIMSPFYAINWIIKL